MVEQGYRCPVCGGEVALAPEGPPVAVAAEAESGQPDEAADRRFDRE